MGLPKIAFPQLQLKHLLQSPQKLLVVKIGLTGHPKSRILCLSWASMTFARRIADTSALELLGTFFDSTCSLTS